MLTDTALTRVDTHWALSALGSGLQERARQLAENIMVRAALGGVMQVSEMTGGDGILEQVSMAYEMAAMEGMEALLHPGVENAALREQCQGGASRAFDLRRAITVPSEPQRRVFQVLHLGAIAYCGERWIDFRRWLKEHPDTQILEFNDGSAWSRRILERLFACWISLLRKQGWDDLGTVGRIVAELRLEQATYEASELDEGTGEKGQIALALVGLYHWAKATELLSTYMLQGEPNDINALLDRHYEAAGQSCMTAGDAQLTVLLRWLHVASRQMVSGSVWHVARAVNSRVTRFVRSVTQYQGLFELLPPQRMAIQQQGLLDPAATAVVIDLPTSGGKTLLAQFRILQALNQFQNEGGWVAYVAPTRALVSQISRRLLRDFEPIGIRVHQLTGAVEIDALEEAVFADDSSEGKIDVFVGTPEKFQLVIRNQRVPRPLALVVMDEAHNIENDSRGLGIELLLATIRRDCPTANFMLLMPYVERPEVLSQWLAHDIHAGKAISLGTSPWKPNDRIIGLFKAVANDAVRAGWHMTFETIVTARSGIQLEGEKRVGGVKPLNLAKSKVLTRDGQTGFSMQTAAMGKIFSFRGTSVVVGSTIPSVWSMANEIGDAMSELHPLPSEIKLVQDFLRTEIGADFELVGLLAKGIAVHHAGLSDDARSLIEWLAEKSKLKVLCATSTISQGINFPVSSVFIASRHVRHEGYSKEMQPRDFWNLAGRAGRLNQDSVGVVGLAQGDDRIGMLDFLRRATGSLVSRLVGMVDALNINEIGGIELEQAIYGEQWEDFRSYVAHLWNQHENLQVVLGETEQLLRNTLGYTMIRQGTDGTEKARRLLDATRQYVRKLSTNPGTARLADLTGFSPEGVGKALREMGQLRQSMSASDWMPSNLFGGNSRMADLYGVLLRLPRMKDSLHDITGNGAQTTNIADITKAWVNGKGIQEIAREFFEGDDGGTNAITNACKAIFRTILNSGTWGFAALSQMSGLDFEALSEDEQRKLKLMPAMVYHGVNTEAAVLMRMNSVPRSIAGKIGEQFLADSNPQASVAAARAYLKGLDVQGWETAKPRNAAIDGIGYKRIWEILSGEG